jgi:hypothetical protein
MTWGSCNMTHERGEHAKCIEQSKRNWPHDDPFSPPKMGMTWSALDLLDDEKST